MYSILLAEQSLVTQPPWASGSSRGLRIDNKGDTRIQAPLPAIMTDFQVFSSIALGRVIIEEYDPSDVKSIRQKAA